MYIIPYEADFTCPKGHGFTAPVGAFAKTERVTCPVCYQEWIDANVPKGLQSGPPRRADLNQTMDTADD